MTPKDAFNIIKEKHQEEKVIECLEFDDFFAFCFVDKEVDEEAEFGSAYNTVLKKNGTLSTFNPTDNIQAYMVAKPIKLNALI